jgi:hypothetical protein
MAACAMDLEYLFPLGQILKQTMEHGDYLLLLWVMSAIVKFRVFSSGHELLLRLLRNANLTDDTVI